MNGEGKEARQEKQDKVNAEFYKDCLGLKSCLRILGDAGYVRRLYSINHDPASVVHIHADMMKLFGVEQFSFRTPWCVLNDVESSLKKAIKKFDECDGDEYPYKLVLCKEKVDYWTDIKKYVSQLDICCEHSSKPITSGQCIKNSLQKQQNELLETFILGTASCKRRENVKKAYGMPSFWVSSDKITLYPKKGVGESQEKLMKDFKKRYLARKKAMKAEAKKARREKIDKVNAKFYGKCFRMKSCLRVLGDIRYVRHLFSINRDPAAVVEIHNHMMKLFRVEEFSFQTSWCVLDEVESNLKRAVKKVTEWDGDEYDFEWDGDEYVSKLAKYKKLADYWIDLKEYVSELDIICCKHSNKPLNSGDCIQESLQNHLLEPFVMGTTHWRNCKKVYKEFKMPSLFLMRSGNTSLYPKKIVNEDQKKVMKAFIKKRYRARKVELKVELNGGTGETSHKEFAARELESKELEPNGATGETSHKRKRKRKRGRKKHEV